MSCSTSSQDISKSGLGFILTSEYVNIDWIVFKLKPSLLFVSVEHDEMRRITSLLNNQASLLASPQHLIDWMICHPCQSQKIIEKADKYDQSAYETATFKCWWLVDSFHSESNIKQLPQTGKVRLRGKSSVKMQLSTQTQQTSVWSTPIADLNRKDQHHIPKGQSHGRAGSSCLEQSAHTCFLHLHQQ